MPAMYSDSNDAKTPLRVLHYLYGESRGGIEEHSLSILSALSREGNICHLAASPALLEQLNGEVSANSIRTLAIRRTGALDYRDALRFVLFVRKNRIEIVHSHLMIGSMFASPLARLARIPGVVETFHLREVWRESKRFKRSFWFDHHLARFVDRYIAVSDATAQHLLLTKRIERTKVRTILNGRDLDRFHPPSVEEAEVARRELGIKGGLMVLLLGRLEEQKGHAFAIEALRQIHERSPNIFLFFAGEGQLESKLKEQCKNANLLNVIYFLGRRNDPERLLEAADLVLLPSTFEGLPLSIVEAMACAVPVIASDIDGTREIVIHEQTGLLVPPEDASSIAASIIRLANDRSLRRRLGENGRQFVEQHFDVKRQVAQTANLYDELLGGAA